MLGKFQQSYLRIELQAPEGVIRESLLHTSKLRQWLWTQKLSSGLPETLYTGLIFTSWVGFVTIVHDVEFVSDNCLRMILSQGIDGYHEWYWGQGWIQSRIEGISLLPLNLGQTLSLIALREFLSHK